MLSKARAAADGVRGSAACGVASRAAGDAARLTQQSVSTAVRAGKSALRQRRVHELSPEQRESVRLVFDGSDTTHDGAIDQSELRAAIHSLTGRWLAQDELDALWGESGAPPGADRLSFEQFLLAVGPEMFPSASSLALRAAGDKARAAKGHALDRAEAAAAASAEAVIRRTLDAVGAAISQDLAGDPDMPTPLRRACERAVDAAMADVEVEVREKVLGLIRRRADPRTQPAPAPARSLVACAAHALASARAWVLYTLYPHDQTIWRQLRWPSFWALKLVSVFPLYGVQPAFFIAEFLLLDRSDEYQLVRYILLFKGAQFFTLGVLGTVLGGGWYFFLGCDVEMPISLYGAILFCAQIGVVWLAFVLLPYSEEKGRPAYRTLPGDAPEVPAGVSCGKPYYKGRGGRLRTLLIYDTIVFAGVLGCALAALAIVNTRTRLIETVYWARTLYGLCSLPFLLFSLPVVGAGLSHSIPTGYDRRGTCVRVLSRREREAAHAQPRGGVQHAGAAAGAGPMAGACVGANTTPPPPPPPPTAPLAAATCEPARPAPTTQQLRPSASQPPGSPQACGSAAPACSPVPPRALPVAEAVTVHVPLSTCQSYAASSAAMVPPVWQPAVNAHVPTLSQPAPSQQVGGEVASGGSMSPVHPPPGVARVVDCATCQAAGDESTRCGNAVRTQSDGPHQLHIV